MSDQEFREWLDLGIIKGWISAPFCEMHDPMPPILDEEDRMEYEAGGDPCLLRVAVNVDLGWFE